MTREEFYDQYCAPCGSQRCPQKYSDDDEVISTCGYYNGDIEGIRKNLSTMDVVMKQLRSGFQAMTREEKLGEENSFLRTALIDHIKHWNDDLCKHCSNRISCEKRECERYQEGVGGWLNGQRVEDLRWSCRDFDFGTCGKMVGTPCEGCFENDYYGFSLDLSTFGSYGGA